MEYGRKRVCASPCSRPARESRESLCIRTRPRRLRSPVFTLSSTHTSIHIVVRSRTHTRVQYTLYMFYVMCQSSSTSGRIVAMNVSIYREYKYLVKVVLLCVPAFKKKKNISFRFRGFSFSSVLGSHNEYIFHSIFRRDIATRTRRIRVGRRKCIAKGRF